ncbi:uncharacterized protein LOC134534310 isoform X2 [Bacillus rossius redtenbacheri]|uniref:uncharacterized protein LOC134534310 isoform X2 n=1 Tax=Bacillus rossius redtenbacheri TaxID=93214 RepID=UPI002FDD45A2
MSFTIKISNRAFRVLSGYLARWVPPILETGFKSGLFIAYAQSNAQEKPLSITQIPGMGDVTHRSLIRQACAGSLETSLQLLTFTVNAFSDVSGRYRAAVQRHAGLMTELMEPGVSDLYKQRLWDGVMDARLESQELRTSLQYRTGYPVLCELGPSASTQAGCRCTGAGRADGPRDAAGHRVRGGVLPGRGRVPQLQHVREDQFRRQRVPERVRQQQSGGRRPPEGASRVCETQSGTGGPDRVMRRAREWRASCRLAT